jgi:arylsulfatase A-like enzyme
VRRASLSLLIWAVAAAAAQPIYRFDDNLKSAFVAAHRATTSSRLADPISWTFDDQNITWFSLRGRMGFRKGELVVQGQGSSPVIQSPKGLEIDWSRYESVDIRMMAEGGAEVKIKIGEREYQKKLGPPKQYQVYRFELGIEDAIFGRPLAVMPTDSTSALVAIDSVEIVPKRVTFPDPAGLRRVAKRDDYRNALYAHTPSSISYKVAVPTGGRVTFALGVAEKARPVTFRIVAGGREVFSKTASDPDAWEEASADLSAFGGRAAPIVFETRGETGAVGLWANPVLSSRSARTRPNVLLYLVDTLRAGHTGVHGYWRDTTPFLKSLAATGVVFEDCHAQATWTKPSVASMMTSLYSYTHGILHDTDTIPRGAITLAGEMRRSGYVTASAVANPFAGRTTGLDRGFDTVLEFPAVLRHRTERVDRGTDSAALHRAILPWLEAHKDEPFFLYLHSTDPHAPYRPPAGVEEVFANPAETPAFDRDYAAMRGVRQYGGGTVVSRADFAARGVDAGLYTRRAIERYDGEVLHNDSVLEMLYGKLKQLGVLEDTILIVVSDHGEEFLEHGWTSHGHALYQELTHSLFLMWNPRRFGAVRRVSEPVQLIDLAPTLLDLLGIAPSGVVQGTSLLPLARGLPFTRKGPVMSSRFAHQNPRTSGAVPENLTGTFAWIGSRWKLLYRDQAMRAGLPEVELYDRAADRGDTRNVAASNPEVVARLRAEVAAWIEAQKQVRTLLGPRGASTLDPKTIERLRSLGYIGGKTQ